MHCLRILLLGAPRITLNNEPHTLNRRKSLALLAYLAIEPGPHSRDALATLLWPGYDQTSARSNLRRTLSLLIASIGQDWLDVERESVALPTCAGLFVDAVEFEKAVGACDAPDHEAGELDDACLERLHHAATLYRDDFLSGFTLADSESFDDWQRSVTEHLRRRLSEALQRLALHNQERSDFADAIAHTRRWLALDPMHEPAHRMLMHLHVQCGDRSSAVHQYEVCVQVLDAELGMKPEAETTALYEDIRAGRAIADAKVQQAAEPRHKTLHNLPEQPTSFVGHALELAQIQRRLEDPQCRLLTIVGPGGMGKTRLSIESAAQQLDAFRDGVFFVDLTSAISADLLASTILHTVASDVFGDSNARKRLFDHLHDKHLLLILDNFEHLLEGADLLPQLMQNAPGIKIMVTSRERLNLPRRVVAAAAWSGLPRSQ